MVDHEFRLSDHLLAENDANNGQFVLKARDEVGRGKRFGMSGEIELAEEEALTFAKWVFACDLEE